MNTGVVIGDKLDSQIFEGSHSAGWKIKIRQLLSLKCSRNFPSFNILVPMHVHMSYNPRSHPSKIWVAYQPWYPSTTYKYQLTIHVLVLPEINTLFFKNKNNTPPRDTVVYGVD